MNMLAAGKDALERKLATPRGKGYSSVANEDLSLLDDRTSEQLRTDGWHLDEVESDEELDFALPTNKRAGSERRCQPTVCTSVIVCCVVS